MLMEQGLSVVHLFGKSTPNLDREAVIAAVKEAEEADCQVITAAMIGHKSDVAFMALCADWRTLRRLQTALQHAGLDIVDSYVLDHRGLGVHEGHCPKKCCAVGSPRPSRPRA